LHSIIQIRDDFHLEYTISLSNILLQSIPGTEFILYIALIIQMFYYLRATT